MCGLCLIMLKAEEACRRHPRPFVWSNGGQKGYKTKTVVVFEGGERPLFLCVKEAWGLAKPEDTTVLFADMRLKECMSAVAG